MKQLGIIRRIDELGRIVIPKELRKTLRIRDGENLEIYVDDDKMILRKFSFMNKINDFAQDFVDAIYTFVKHTVIVTDNDRVIAASGELRKQYMNKNISEQMEMAIKRREDILEKHVKKIQIVENEDVSGTYCINSIVVDSDTVGLVIIFSTNEQIGELEQGIVKIASNFLSKYLEQ